MSSQLSAVVIAMVTAQIHLSAIRDVLGGRAQAVPGPCKRGRWLRYTGHGYGDLWADFHCKLHVNIEHRHPQALSRSKKVGEKYISDEWPSTWQEYALRLSLGGSGQDSAPTRSSAGRTPRQYRLGPGREPVNSGRRCLLAVAPGGRWSRSGRWSRAPSSPPCLRRFHRYGAPLVSMRHFYDPKLPDHRPGPEIGR